MKALTVYSSTPVGLKLACVFQNLKNQGLEVVLRPLSELPPVAPPAPRCWCPALRAERTNLQVRLAGIGDELTAFEDGSRAPDAGAQQGLLAERDALLSRVKGLSHTIEVQERGMNRG